MQRILSILCIGSFMLLTHPQANAQEQLPAKNNLIGAGLSFNSDTDDKSIYGVEQKNTTATAVLTYARYIKRNVALGVQAGYTSTTQEYTGTIDPFLHRTNNRSYSLAPFVRLDIPLWHRFSIFNDIGIGGDLGRSRTKTNEGTIYTSSFWGLNAFYNPGLMFRLKDNISLQLSYGGLLSYHYSHAQGMNSHEFGLLNDQRIGDLRLGINFLL